MLLHLTKRYLFIHHIPKDRGAMYHPKHNLKCSHPSDGTGTGNLHTTNCFYKRSYE